MSHHNHQYLPPPATNVAAIAAAMSEMHHELMSSGHNVMADSSDQASSSVGSAVDNSDDSSLRDSWGSRDNESSDSYTSSEDDDDSDASFSDDDSLSMSDDDSSGSWDDSSSSSCSHLDDDSLEVDGNNISHDQCDEKSDDPLIKHSRAVLEAASAHGEQNCHPNIHNAMLLRRRSTKQVKVGDDECSDNSRQPSRDADPHNNCTQPRVASKTRSNPQRRRQVNTPKQSRNRKSKKSSSLTTHRFLHYMHSTTSSTKLLCLSFTVWTSIQLYVLIGFHKNYVYQTIRNSMDYTEFVIRDTRGWSGRQKKAWMREHAHEDDYHPQRYYSPAQMEELRQRRYREAKLALGSAAEDQHEDYLLNNNNNNLYSGKPNTRRNKRSSNSDSHGSTRDERLREGCAELEWHSYHFPTCNDIHEIDLRGVVRNRLFGVDVVASRRRGEGDDDDGKEQKNALPWGFVGNGLWRDVFSCDPRGEVVNSVGSQDRMPPAVLKMMKSEHPYDQRNFQRHRRDALVMELLSSSHHLVQIYGYCANTVLTQAISHTLDDVIYAREKEKVKLWSPKGGYQTKPKLEAWMGKDDKGELLATRETEIGRIRLALGVFRGLVDLHEGVGYKNMNGVSVEWLPIVHADLQAKQYLVDSTTGQIYLNDFNRCRFVTKKENNKKTFNTTEDEAITANSTNSTIESCPFYIPTAPGSARSPEEYDMAPLSEKLDVYSAGNILYGIITGKRPWDDERGRHIKSYIQRGDRPEVNETIRNANGTVDAELTRLLGRVYEGDPVKRASAKEIVRELELLLQKQLLDHKVTLL
ncbi:hypothetical protein ACHAWX_001100 [Stephanocyclus meneghinianus]